MALSNVRYRGNSGHVEGRSANAASGRYVNCLDDDETGDPVAAAYGPNYRRLQELKTKYDPNNFFK